MRVEAHVSDYKKSVVDSIAKHLVEYPIIGAVNMQGLPAPQLQVIRGKLRDKMLLVMARRNLLKLAIEKAKKSKQGLEELEKHLGGMPALLFTKESPFKIYNVLRKSKSRAAAKAGQIAPYDLIVPAGPTPFAPGPIIGELGMIGIKTGVENGKVTIVKDSIITKEGEVIKQKAAEVLTRFGVQPMEIGIDLVAVWENGIVYGKDILAVDEEAYIANIGKCQRWAFNLSVEAGYFAKETTELIISKAFNDAKALAAEAKIDVSEKLAAMLAKSGEKHEAKQHHAEKPATEEAKPVHVPTVEKHEARHEPKPEHVKTEITKVEVKSHAAPNEMPKVADIIKQTKERYTQPAAKEEEPSAEKIVEEIEKAEPKKVVREPDDAARLFEELKKKGTLRGVDEEKSKVVKVKKQLEPGEIIEEYAKKKALEKERERVPSAHELLQRKLENNKEG